MKFYDTPQQMRQRKNKRNIECVIKFSVTVKKWVKKRIRCSDAIFYVLYEYGGCAAKHEPIYWKARERLVVCQMSEAPFKSQ